jgi:hypothetical protein
VKPPKLGTVWAAAAKIQVIDASGKTPRWKTLATCSDTPNAIAAAAKKLRAPGRTLWVVGDVTDRQILA